MLKKILIIDDDLYIRELYEEVLKDAGYDVDTAEDGQQGLEKIIKGSFDLVLLDVMMPKLDGLGVLDGVEVNKPKDHHGKIILLTNLSHDPVIQDAMKKGAATFMIKADITPEQLLQKVKEYLQ